MIPWVTVETLAPEGFSVASVGDVPRGFADWRRVLQRQLAKTPALYDGITTRDIVGAIRTSMDKAEDVDCRIETRSGPHRLLIRPIFGPSGDVHAVRLWIGPESAVVPALPTAAGAIWDLDDQIIAQPHEITRFSGMVAEEYVPRMSIAEFFQRVSGFDRHAELLDLLYEPESGCKLQFDVAMRHSAARATRWRITIRARDDNRTRGAWWLIEDTTAGDEPNTWPTLESVGLREAHRRAGNHLAVVQLSHATIAHWLTDPAPWVRWDYLFQPVDVFHPDDRVRLVEVSERVRRGETAALTVRTLNYGGGYTPTSLLLYPYPGFSNHELSIAQLVCTTGEGASAAEHANIESNRSGQHVGDADQLRNHLVGRLP